MLAGGENYLFVGQSDTHYKGKIGLLFHNGGIIEIRKHPLVFLFVF